MMTPDEERFWEKVALPSDKDECWLWTAATDVFGYGRFRMGDRTLQAHRLAWLFSQKEETALDARIIMHSCDVPACCNPAHLMLGTRRDNNADMHLKGRARHPLKTHCNRGHEYTPENTLITSGGKARFCRICHRQRRAAYLARKTQGDPR